MMSVCTACSQVREVVGKMDALVTYMEVCENEQCTSLEMDHAMKGCETAGVALPKQSVIDILLMYETECCERDDPAAIVKIFEPTNQIFSVNRYESLSAKDKETVQDNCMFAALTSILWKPDDAITSMPAFMNASVNNPILLEQIRLQLRVIQDALLAETIQAKQTARCIYMYV